MKTQEIKNWEHMEITEEENGFINELKAYAIELQGGRK